MEKSKRFIYHCKGIFFYYKFRDEKPYYNKHTKSMNAWRDCWYVGVQLGGTLWGREEFEYDGMKATAFNVLGVRFFKGYDYEWEDLGNVQTTV